MSTPTAAYKMRRIENDLDDIPCPTSFDRRRVPTSSPTHEKRKATRGAITKKIGHSKVLFGLINSGTS